MAGILFPHGNNAAPDLVGFKVQTSVYGLPIPIVYGAARIAANLIHNIPMAAEATSAKPSKWTSRTQTGWNYPSTLALALCEGPLTPVAGSIIGYVWADKDAADLWASYAAAGWIQLTGTHNQAAWAALPSGERVPYQYTAYAANPKVNLPNNVIPNLSWEVYGLFLFDVGSAIYDALPSAILSDFLTNANHGLGFPSSKLASLTPYETYCGAADLLMSPALTSLQPGRQFVDDLMLATNSALVWSDGLLKIIPYGDQPLSGRGYTFTPNTTPEYDLSDADFMANEGDDPVIVSRVDPASAFNQVVVEFESRFDANGNVAYNTDSVQASADAAVNGMPLPAPKITLPMIKVRDIARIVAQTQLQRHQLIRNSYAFKLGWKFSLLEPMDLVTLTDVDLGLSLTPVRIIEVVELADAAGIQITAEDWPIGTATATKYPSQGNAGFRPNLNADPGDTVVGAILEPPTGLLQSPLDIWIAASGGSDWGGCDIYLSTDGFSYSKVGQITARASFGELTATLPINAALPSIDTTHTLSVDLTASQGAAPGVSNSDFIALLSLCWVDGEFLAYRDSSLTSAFNYDLTHLGRGAYSSTPAAHLATAPFLKCDDAVYRYPFPAGTLGQTLYFKFPAFNVYGNALQDLAGVSAITHTIGTPSIPFGSSNAIDIEVSAQTPTYPSATLKFTATATAPSGGTPNIRIKSIARTTVLSGLAVGTYGASPQTWEVNLPVAGAGAATVILEAQVGSGPTSTVTLTIPEGTTLGGLQGTVSIDTNGRWGFTLDGPSTAQSFKWASSTSSYPADATVAASGTGVNSPAPFTVTAGGTLAFGDTVFITIVPFTLTSYGGIFGPAIHIRGSYQTFSASKTVTFSKSAWKQTYTFTTSGIAPVGLVYDSGGNPANVALPATSLQNIALGALCPVGGLLHSADIEGVWNTAAVANSNYLAAVYAAGSLLNSGHFSYAGGAQTVTLGLADTPVAVGDEILILDLWNGPISLGPDGSAGQCLLGNVSLTFISPTPDVSI